MYGSKPDNALSLRPLSIGILTESKARIFHKTFMDHFNPVSFILDPLLHNFEAVKESALLSSAVFLVGARGDPDGTFELCNRLQQHILQVLIPATFLDGYRSIEIVQALLILSAYHPPTEKASEDRTWTWIGMAIRIASSLEAKPCVNSHRTLSGSSAPGDEARIRKARNIERTWLNLHVTELIYATLTGRRATLWDDATIRRVNGWDKHPLALEFDRSLVCLVELKKVFISSTEAFDAIADTLVYDPSAEERMLATFYARTKADLASWWERNKSDWFNVGHQDNMYRKFTLVPTLLHPIRHG